MVKLVDDQKQLVMSIITAFTIYDDFSSKQLCMCCNFRLFSFSGAIPAVVQDLEEQTDIDNPSTSGRTQTTRRSTHHSMSH